MTSRRLAPGAIALAGLTLALTLPGPARADLLDPTAFRSLGTLDTGWNTYTVDAGSVGRAPTISDGSGTVVFTGVFSNGVAVFDFDSVNAALVVQETPGAAIAILSRGDLTLTGRLSLGDYGPAGNAYPGSGLGGGAAGGMGGPGDASHNGYPAATGLSGGSGAGNPVGHLGGGGNGVAYNSFGGGYGGGAIELGAIGHVTVGDIDARGDSGSNAQGLGAYAGGGGGGGGAVMIHGDSVSILGHIDVGGGQGGLAGYAGGGGGGGGGSIAIRFNNGDYDQSYSDALNVAGGAGGAGAFSGETGTISVVPEPTSLALLAPGIVGLASLMARRRRAAP